MTRLDAHRYSTVVQRDGAALPIISFGQRGRWHLNDMPATPAIAGPAESHGRYSEPSLFSLLGREA
jgi:hypothetical protein